MTMKECPFCSMDREVLVSNKQAYAVYDKYPVSEGHVLVISSRHVADYFELQPEEKSAMWSLVDEVKELLEKKYHPDGYNVGFNVNHAAGQTIFHLHIHVIPRYEGDIKDPTGGVRGVIPEKRIY